MANRFAMKKMPGVISDFQYSMWWNGGMRTTPYFHNMIGILTEVAHATPTPRFYDPANKPNILGSRRSSTPTNGTDIFYPYPWEGGHSSFRDAVEYMITASMGILSIAADRKAKWLYNIYSMGRDAQTASAYHAYLIPRSQWDAGEKPAPCRGAAQNRYRGISGPTRFHSWWRTIQGGDVRNQNCAGISPDAPGLDGATIVP